MASEFLTIEQVCEQLGITPEDVKAMVAEGRLGEVRDAGKMFYRAKDVERLAAKEGSSVVDLAVTDETSLSGADETESFASALSSLADSSTGLSALDDSAAAVSPISPIEEISPIPLDEAAPPAPVELSEIPDQLPAAPPDEGAEPEMSSEIGLLPVDASDASGDRTSFSSEEQVPDLGLSGTDVISLERADEVDAKKTEDKTRITSAGISVFDDDELDIEADPMEKTHIAPVEDFDAVGSGSGLLDLTRESDDTSLGQILDVISPTEGAETEAEAAIDDDAVVAEPVEDSADVVEAAGVEQPFEPAGATVAARRATGVVPGAMPLNVCLILGVLSMALLGLMTAAQVQGIFPDIIRPITGGVTYMSVAGGLLGAGLITGLIGILAGRKR